VNKILCGIFYALCLCNVFQFVIEKTKYAEEEQTVDLFSTRVTFSEADNQ